MVPNLLAMLCILAVFLPSFLMEGAARGLFVPLAIAVGFAMITAFVLSITFVPVLSIWLAAGMRHGTTATSETGRSGGACCSFARFRRTLRRTLSDLLLPLRWYVVPVYFVAAGLVLWLVGGRVGREIAPQVDSGQFQLRIRAPSGTRLEVSEEITRKALEGHQGRGRGRRTSRFRSPMSASRRRPTRSTPSTSGPAAPIRRSCAISLRQGSGLRVAEVKDKLRDGLPKRLEPWLAERLEAAL